MVISNIKLIPLIETLRLENISDEVYFSTKFSNYISNSRLGLINPKQNGTPEKFFNGGFNAVSDSLVFGSALHSIVLQPESYFICESVNRPTGKTGYIADYCYNNTNNPTDTLIEEAIKKYNYYKGITNDSRISQLRTACKDYWETRYDYEKSNLNEKIPIYLDNKSRNKINSCLDSLKKDDKIQSILNTSFNEISANEQTILLDVLVEINGKEEFILKLKSKLDNYKILGNNISVNDLKTTGKYVDIFQEAINNFHYSREIAMYSWLFSLCAKKFYNISQANITGNFLVVSTIPNYNTMVVPMTRKMFLQGFEEFKTLTKLVAYYVKINPRYRNFASL